MTDEVDRACELGDRELALTLDRLRDRPLPVGTAGECDECGRDMPRLVGGRCGYCRDGRRG